MTGENSQREGHDCAWVHLTATGKQFTQFKPSLPPKSWVFLAVESAPNPILQSTLLLPLPGEMRSHLTQRCPGEMTDGRSCRGTIHPALSPLEFAGCPGSRARLSEHGFGLLGPALGFLLWPLRAAGSCRLINQEQLELAGTFSQPFSWKISP